MRYKRLTQNSLGFTLIELAVVLLVIGVLLTGLLTPLASVIEQKRRSDMTEQFKEIENALIGFAILSAPYHRLPCPDCLAAEARCKAADVGDGREDVFVNHADETENTAKHQICKVGEVSNKYFSGGLPWATLGVASTDPWGRVLRYHVVADLSEKAGPTQAAEGCGDGNKAFGLCNILTDIVNRIKIKDACFTESGSKEIAGNIPAAVHSQGAHYSTDINSASPDLLSCHEKENLQPNGDDFLFVHRDYSQSEDQYYDDMLFWLSPYTLITKMVDAGVLP